MLVKELIAKLQELPEHLQDAPVLIDTDKRIDEYFTRDSSTRPATGILPI